MRVININTYIKILLSFLILTNSLIAENLTISGKVLSAGDNKPLIGAVVRINDSDKGAVTNKDGSFSISGLSTGILELRFSYVGYTPDKLSFNLKNDTNIIVFLQETAINYDAVVVTGTRFPRKIKESPVLTEIITNKEIEKSGAVDITKVLEDMSSIDFTPNAHGANASMHGLGPEYVLFLLDGERIAGDMRGNINFSRLNTMNIERIEIVKGAASTLYGSKAIGGVVNIITKQPDNSIGLDFNSRYASYNDLLIGAGVNFKRNWLSSKSSLVFKRSDGFDLKPETVFRTVEEYYDISFDQKFNIKATEKLNLSLGGTYYILERFDAARKYWFKHKKFYDFAYNLGADYTVTDQIKFKLDWNSDKYDTYDVLEKMNNEERMQDQHKFDAARLTVNLTNIARHNIILGAEYIDETVNSPRTTGGKKDANNIVGFLQVDYNLFGKILIVPGFRVDKHSKFGTFLSPKFSAMYTINDINLRASYSRGFKSPSLKELYMSWDHGGAGPYVTGNESLQPETSDHFSFSLEFQHSIFNLTSSVFRTDLKDMIDVRPEIGSPNSFFYENVSSAMTQGAEFIIKVVPLKGLTFSAGYTFVDTENKDTGRDLLNRAKHFGNFSLAYYLSNLALNTNLRAKFTGKKLFEEIENADNSDYTQIYQSPYVIWKLNFSKDFSSLFNINFGIDNLFDYKDVDYLLTPGRVFYIGLGISYSRE